MGEREREREGQIEGERERREKRLRNKKAKVGRPGHAYNRQKSTEMKDRFVEEIVTLFTSGN